MAKKNSSTITVSFNNPIDAFAETALSIKETITTFLDEVFTSSRSERLKMNKYLSNVSLPKFNFNKKSALQIAIPVVVILIVIIGVISITNKRGDQQVAGVTTSSNIVDSVAVKRAFKFPLTDDKGKKVAEFTYEIESAELRKQIVVKGQKATAVDGRIFLILNIKITNNLKQGVTINSRDYVRFEVGSSKELLAADIHNDPVEAQAISTKNTRIGLAVNSDIRKIKLLVGEITGTKTTIPLEFK